MKVVYYDKKVKNFVNSLDKAVSAKLFHKFKLLERFGFELGIPHTKPVKEDLFEIRVIGTVNVRIFYILRGDKAILLHGFIKKTRKLPRREISLALRKRDQFDNI